MHLLWSSSLIFSQDPFKFSYPPLPDDVFQNPISETGQEDDTESKDDDLEAKDTLEPSSPILRTRNVVLHSPLRHPLVLILNFVTLSNLISALNDINNSNNSILDFSDFV